MSPVLLSPCASPIPARFLPVSGGGGQGLLVQETPLTNHQFDLCREKGKGVLYGLVGPSRTHNTLALLGRSGDPEALLRMVPRQDQNQFDPTKLTPGVSLTVGAHTVFHVTDQPSRPGFAGPNRPRIDISFFEGLWAYDLMIPGARLLTHAEWDLVSGVTEGIACATDDGTLGEKQANVRGRVGTTTDVGSFPSFRGFYDLIGNVWEWVLPDRLENLPGLRGWAFSLDSVIGPVSAFRGMYRADNRAGNFGVRGVVALQVSAGMIGPHLYTS